MHAVEYDDLLNFIQRIELLAESKKKKLAFFYICGIIISLGLEILN